MLRKWTKERRWQAGTSAPCVCVSDVGGAVHMQDESRTQTTTDPLVSSRPRCSPPTAHVKNQPKQNQKTTHILYSTNPYAYFTIYFYYHFNKYKNDTVIQKKTTGVKGKGTKMHLTLGIWFFWPTSCLQVDEPARSYSESEATAENGTGRERDIFAIKNGMSRQVRWRRAWIYTLIYIHTHTQRPPECKITWDTLCTSFPEHWPLGEGYMMTTAQQHVTAFCFHPPHPSRSPSKLAVRKKTKQTVIEPQKSWTGLKTW